MNRNSAMGALLCATAMAVAGTGCGESTSSGPKADLKTAATKLENIRSGRIDLQMRTAGGQGSPTATLGLAGRFGPPPTKGAPPVLELTVTRAVGSKPTTTELRSTGTAVWARSPAGPWRKIEGPKATDLGTLGPSPVSGIHLAAWATSPVRQGDDIRGQLDAAALLSDLAPAVGAAAPTSDDAERLHKATTASAFAVHLDRTGRPQTVHAEVTFSIPGQEALARSLGPLGASTLTLDLTLADVGTPVTVDPPPP